MDDRTNELLEGLLKIANPSSEAREKALDAYHAVKKAVGSDAEGAVKDLVEDLVGMLEKEGPYDNFAGQSAATGLNKAVAELTFNHEEAGPCSVEFVVDLTGSEDEKRSIIFLMYVDRELVASRSLLSDLDSAAESILPEIDRGLSQRTVP